MSRNAARRILRKFGRNILSAILWTTFGAASLWAWPDSTPWVGGALAAMFFGKAALPLFQLVGALKGRPVELVFAKGFRGMAIGYVAAGCLVALSALWQQSFFGFLVAYGAFSFAWAWFWIARMLTKLTKGNRDVEQASL